MSRTAWNWSLAALAAFFLSASHLLGPDPDLSGELSAAQQQARNEARHEQAAAQHCTKALGYGAAHRWTPDGRLVCTTHRSPKPILITENSKP
jgi:hypothetical protein